MAHFFIDIYKHQLNKIKLRKNQLYGLLKLRYKFECDMDMYIRFASDSIWENAKKTTAKLFDEKTLLRSYDYRYLTDSPMASMKRIREQVSVLIKNFEDKGTILQHLEGYKHELQARLVNYIIFFMAVLTLILLIFPDWNESIAEFLEKIWIWFISVVNAHPKSP